MRVALLLALCACGPPIVTECRYGPIVIAGEVALDCAAVIASGDVLRAIHTKPLREAIALDPQAGYSFEDPWPSPPPVDRWGGFDEAFRGYRVVVLDTTEAQCGDKVAAGCNNHAETHLGLAGAPMSWAHESLHFLECRAGNCDNVGHVGWAENGYANLGIAYAYVEHRSWLDTGDGGR